VCQYRRETFMSFQLTVLCQRILYTLLQEGKPYMDAVFNETVNITESDEGIDGET